MMHKDTTVVLSKTMISAGSSVLAALSEDGLKISGALKVVDGMSGNAVSLAVKNGFKAEKGELKMLYPAGKLHAVLLLGLGKRAELKQDQFIDGVADGAKAARSAGITELHVLADSFGVEDSIRGITLGSMLGTHRFMKYKTKDLAKVKNLGKITIMAEDPAKQQKAFDEAKIVADAVKKTRDMVNTPPNVAGTEEVAQYAKKIAAENRLKCTLLEEKDMEKLGMGCITAVGKGSAAKPKIAILEYNGGAGKPVLLVGKGVTFDSGGYNLKPTNYINNMKDDKAGAITMLHVIEAVARLGVKANVVAAVALAENMVSGMAYRPDDILKAYNGMTVEVTNTDAEGRLVLADTLAYSVEKHKPQAVVDIATLTGATMIALGHFTTPIVGTDEKLIGQLKEAADATGEKVWQLPLWEEYGEAMKSDVADLKNSTDGPDAGVITGAMFLKNFVGEAPWAHLDIGTTVWSKADKGAKQKGATGVCVRTLIGFVKNWK